MELIVRDLRLPLLHPFTTAHGTMAEKHNLLVELRHGGVSGYGEAAPSLAYPEQHLEAIRDAVESVREVVVGHHFSEPEPLWEMLAPLLTARSFALCALDSAAHDLWGKLRGVPVWKLWGLRLDNLPPSNFTIGLDTMDRMVAKLREVDGWPVYKIKLGTPDDLAIVRELRRHTGAPFRVDANTGWTVRQTIAIAPELKALGVEFIEQPLPAGDWAGMREVFEACEMPFIADESFQTEASIDECAKCFSGINLKLAKAGGLTPARRIIRRARRSQGLRVMAGCMVESTVGISALAQLLPMLDYVDMDGAALLATDVADGVRVEQGRAIFPSESGNGVKLHPPNR